MSLRIIEVACGGCQRVARSQTEAGIVPRSWMCPECVAERYAAWVDQLRADLTLGVAS